MKYFFIFLSFCFYCSFLNAQEIDYEQFKGEKVNLRFAVKMLNTSFAEYYPSFKTIKRFSKRETPAQLLSKFYFQGENPLLFINRKSPMINKKERSWFWFRWSC